MRGRKPKPTETKRRNGNPGKRPLNKSEPSAGFNITKPCDLESEASALWDEAVDCFREMGILDRADRVEIEMMCRIYAEWKECLEIVDNEGRICRSMDDKGQVVLKTHPAVRQASDASKRLRAILSDFGMNPVSRVPLGSKENNKPNKFLELLGAAQNN